MYSCHVLFDMLSKLLKLLIRMQYALNVVLTPCHLPAADQPDTPKVSFAILTANEREKLAVNGFLGLECVEQVKYPHASTLLYSSDAVLRDAKAKVKPLPDARYTHPLFSLEVNGSKQVGVHVFCDKMGPWGALHKTVELLKTARDENWELRYIFIVGHCGASVTEAKKNDFPRGTILLAEQVKDYLNTGKVEEDCEEDIAEEMVSGRAPTFKVKGSPTTYQMNPALLTQMIEVQEMDTRGAYNRIEVKKVDYLSGPLVIKSSLFGATFRDSSVDACGVEMEAVGVLKAVETFHTLSGGPKAEVVLAKGISDYTGHKGESGSCKFFDETIKDANDDQVQMNAAMQAIALVIRLVAKKMTWLFGSS